jgi:hypothetical protein
MSKVKTRKTFRASDFKRWLKKHSKEVFGAAECDCPLAVWIGADVTFDVLDKMPAWTNRFVGCWDEKLDQTCTEFESGKVALQVLDEVEA